VSLFRRGKGSADTDMASLSKRDYAHTTGDSPDSTSLIPAIKEDPNGNERGEPTEAIAPVAAPPMPEPPPVQAAVPATGGSQAPTIRGRTGMRLVRVEPYSVTRLAFVVSVLLMIVMTVAVAVFWMALSITGVWSEINQNVAALLSDDSASFDIRDYLGFSRMVGGTLIVSGINVILMTALATVGARLFNLAAALLGGIEATFTDD
jgi:hypothetical protein